MISSTSRNTKFKIGHLLSPWFVYVVWPLSESVITTVHTPIVEHRAKEYTMYYTIV